MGDTRFLVSMDTDQIQGYVFATNKIREVRGASALLAELNEEGRVSAAAKAENGTLVYAGGGAVKAEFGTRQAAEDFIIKEQLAYRQQTVTAGITGVYVATTTQQLETDFAGVNSDSERLLRQAKESKKHAVPSASHPYAQLCPSCGVLPAAVLSKFEPGTMRCAACAVKEQASDRARLLQQFKEWDKLPENWRGVAARLRPSEDVDAIGERSRNYIGLIVCDGNLLGEKLKEFKKKDDFQKFSQLVKETTKREIFRAVAEHCPPEEKARFEFILLGGDDLVLIVPGNVAVSIAREFCQGFYQAMRNAATNHASADIANVNQTGINFEVSMSAGVAIAHSHYPLRALHRVAEDLLKSAKKLSTKYKQQGENASALDFMVISTPSTNPVGTVRQEELTRKEGVPFHLYYRPYRVAAKGISDDHAGLLLTHIASFRREGFPRRVLNQMWHALRQEKFQSIYEYLLLRSRLGGKAKICLQNFEMAFGLCGSSPWLLSVSGEEYFSPLADLIELYDFAEGW
ncbi:MAG: hypothetical protein DDT38_00117 [Firmicutes bacterium]|nr:hypothetical protein [candidate division NPL-UPA2 bacterium]